MLGKAGMQKLSDVTIVSKNDYACVTVVSLDDKPIATSRRILAQIGTIARPTGWKEKPMRISDQGRHPRRQPDRRCRRASLAYREDAWGDRCQKPLDHQGHHPRPQRYADQRKFRSGEKITR